MGDSWFRRALVGLVLVVQLSGCNASTEKNSPADTVWVEFASRRFALELAADSATRHRGLGGREQIARNGGMIFVFPRAALRGFVMRDCLVPIDIAFLDEAGRVLSVESMQVERPRAPRESRRDYESRLPSYDSPAPALFAIEMAGGRLGELGLRVGDAILFDRESALGRAR